MSLKRAVSISLGSLSGSVGSKLSNEGSSNDRLFIFAIFPLCNTDCCGAQERIFKVPTFARASGSETTGITRKVICNFTISVSTK